MARGINKVILVGNLGQDPELRYTGSGTAVCNMRVATSESYKDRDGNMVENTEWHTVVAWSRLAEICGEYLKKGSQAYFEGSLQTRQWEDKDGNTRYSTEIKVREMQMLGGKGGGGGSDDFDQSERPARAAAAPRSGGGGGGGYGGGGNGGGGGYGGGGNSGGGRPAPRQSQPASDDNYDFSPDDDLPF